MFLVKYRHEEGVSIECWLSEWSISVWARVNAFMVFHSAKCLSHRLLSAVQLCL